jgi:hypothetical protein
LVLRFRLEPSPLGLGVDLSKRLAIEQDVVTA